jgi:hypothetical protein
MCYIDVNILVHKDKVYVLTFQRKHLPNYFWARLKLEAVIASKLSVPIYKTARSHIRNGGSFFSHHPESRSLTPCRKHTW